MHQVGDLGGLQQVAAHSLTLAMRSGVIWGWRVRVMVLRARESGCRPVPKIRCHADVRARASCCVLVKHLGLNGFRRRLVKQARLAVGVSDAPAGDVEVRRLALNSDEGAAEIDTGDAGRS